MLTPASQFVRFFEQAPGFVVFFRGPQHIFELQNHAHAQLTEHRDIIGKPVREAFPELEGQPFFDLLDEVYKTGKPFIGRGLSLKLKRHPDLLAEEHFVDFIYQPVIDEDGQVIGIVSQGNDVTEQVAAQAALEKKQKELEAMVAERTETLLKTREALELARQLQYEKNSLSRLVDQAPGFLTVLGKPEHVFEIANRAYFKIVGNRPLIGLPIREALPELAGQGFFELLDQVYTSGEAHIGSDTPAQLRDEIDGNMYTIYVDFIYQPIHNEEGQVHGILVQGSDVTDRKLAQDEVKRYQLKLETLVEERTRALEEARLALVQSQKLESIGKLTGGIAHDFNNVLQVISGSLQLLRHHTAGQQQPQRYVDTALAAVARGATVASQLLAFARRQPMQPRVVDLARILSRLTGLVHQALGADIEVRTAFAANAWNVALDPHLFESAMLNLAINAKDAMPGGGRLEITLANVELDPHGPVFPPDLRAGSYVRLSVADNGHGMSPEVLERAVEPFYTTKLADRGSGLGLSMVYGFVKQSGGHLQLESEVDVGTTVHLYFPRSDGELSEPRRPASGPARGGNETILVVEDDAAVQETAVAMLGDLGYRVLKADNADAGLVIVKSGVTIDLLFTDVVMPGRVRSVELAEQASLLIPGLKVLFTSGYPRDEIGQGGRLGPEVNLLQKPYGLEELAKRIRAVLDHEDGER